MKRGDIFSIAGGTGPAGKPRPCLIVQRGSTLEGALKVNVCPITSELQAGSLVRPLILPSAENGLDSVSQVKVDWIYTCRVSRLRKRIGSIDDSSMREIDAALRRWLDL